MDYKVCGFATQFSPIKDVQLFAFADALKDDFCQFKGITREYLEENKGEFRCEMYDLSVEKRALDNDHYTKLVAKSIIESQYTGTVVFTDFRQPEELAYMRKMFRNTEWTVVKVVDETKSVDERDPMEMKLIDFNVDVTLTRKR